MLKVQRENSVNVAMALSYTSAKNFYLAMAVSVFSLDSKNAIAAGNFAAATAAYADDLELDGENPTGLQKYYSDAESIYQYALMLAGQEGKKAQESDYTRDALPLLVSLGNLYLDGNKLNEAYACFQTALELEEEYSPATEGLFNTYMAMKQYQKALDLLADSMNYPAFASGAKKTAEKSQADSEKPHVNTPSIEEEVLELKLDSFNTIDSVSAADFIEEIDAEAKQKLDNLIKEVEQQMKYTSPDITIISQYGSLKAISQPLGESAIEAFDAGLSQLYDDLYELESKIEAREPSDEAFDRAEAQMEKFVLRQNADSDTRHGYFKGLAILQPEYAIFAINPYDYANPMDILVQRQNISSFQIKFSNYVTYCTVVNQRVIKNIEEIIDQCNEKIPPLWEEMDDKISDIDPDDPQRLIKVHNYHESYYPKINGMMQVYWNQATSITITAYQQKIKKYAEQMYNDCMKHLILVSDDNIRQMLEERLQRELLNTLSIIFDSISQSFSFVHYEEDCHCDIGALEKLREKLENEREKLANEQIKRNMDAKKIFESGVLDENSEYYKKCIKPYEVTLNTPFVKGVIGPYKTKFKLDLDFVNFESSENHIRNTTTYNGGVEIGKDAAVGPAKIGAKAYVKFTAVKGADGGFAMEDIDVTGGGKATLEAGFVSAEAGMEASAVRGTRSYAGFSATADNFLDDELKKAMGTWAPKLKKELWKGDYPLY